MFTCEINVFDNEIWLSIVIVQRLFEAADLSKKENPNNGSLLKPVNNEWTIDEEEDDYPMVYTKPNAA